MLISFVLAVAVLLLAAQAYVRLAPSDPERWHVDPAAIEKPDYPGHFLVCPETGDIPGPRFAVTADQLMQALDAVAMATPNTRRLAGAVDARHVTYVTRTAFWGFPDYTSVRAVPAEDDESASRAMIFARLRFGSDDLGVNRARVEQWLAATEARLDG